MEKIVHKWAKELNISKLLERKPKDLSGGQKQAVSIAGVLVSDVPILLLDEPLANLDPKSGRATMKLVRDLAERLGYTVVVIEHRLEEALLLNPDRIIAVSDGRIVFDGCVEDILKSDKLDQIGIRKPLYIDALSYAGLDLKKYERISKVDDLDLSKDDLEILTTWASKVKKEKIVKSREKIIEIKNLDFAYSNENILENINLSINKGEIVSIVGPNGAGKSTLAKLMCGFIRPNRGEILIDGIDSKNLSIKEIADKIAFVLQNPNSMISKTMIYDEVAFGLRIRGLEEEEIQKRVEEVLKICGLYPFRNWPISALSYGQKRRVTIASILILNPDLIILDEPTAGQDFSHYTAMMEFIRRLNRDLSLTILMISHDMHLIQEYTDRALVVCDKKILADLSPAELFSREKLIDQSNLAPTSLYKLGKKLEALSALDFIESFIAYERRKKNG